MLINQNFHQPLPPKAAIGPISTIMIPNGAKKPTGAKTDWANLDRNLARRAAIGPISTIDLNRDNQ